MRRLYNGIWILVLLVIVGVLCGCTQHKLVPIDETYQYFVKHKNYLKPAAVDGWVEKDALSTTNSDGTFFCFTTDAETADNFINTQRTLLRFLMNCGVEIGEMEYHGTDYGYSFSQSDENAVYVSLSDMRSWKQVLVTLQAIWGDYTEYGYVYAMSNAIAGELGWQTDSISTFEQRNIDRFFGDNPDVINLLYPTFTTNFASEETVNYSKALAVHLFEKVKWKKALGKQVEEQLGDYYSMVSTYAQNLSIPFTSQSCGYAYYGENVKLRIMTTYAELIIDSNYRDVMESIYGDYWDNYSSIYQTTNTINREITAAVEYFALEDEAGTIRIKWLDSENSATERFTEGRNGMYHPSTHVAYVVSINPYLHEYYHHIEYLINHKHDRCWQSQAFCEMGKVGSWHAQYRMEKLFSDGKWAELFYLCTGHNYQPKTEDYYEVYDILCYIGNDYTLDYYSGGNPINSFSRYLIDRYGEDDIYQLMLLPETVETVTGKTWETLQKEWKQHIQEKYVNVELPDWV